MLRRRAGRIYRGLRALLPAVALLAGLTAAAPAMTLAAGSDTGSAPAGFPDVPSDFWAAGGIAQLVHLGVLSGFPDGEFGADLPVTRGQFTKILVLAEHLPVAGSSDGGASFCDVPPGYWAYPYVEAAYQQGVVNGVGHGCFDPGAPVSRQDMAVMIGRSLGLSPVAGELQAPAFADAPSIAAYASGYVRAAADLGLVNGLPGDRFEPRAATTRAQAAVVADRVLSVPPGRVDAELTAVARDIVLQAPNPSVGVGATEQLQVSVTDAQGRDLKLQPTLTASAGAIAPGGSYTAPATPGTVTIQAQLGSLTAQLSLTVAILPASLSLSASAAQVAAGSPVTLTASALAAGGAVVSGDQGRTIRLQISGPADLAPLSETDQAGVASFSFTPTVAGSYTLQAASDGLAASPQVQLAVSPGSPAKLALAASPSSLDQFGQRTAIQATLQDAYGNQVDKQASVDMQVSPAGAGNLDASHSFIVNGSSVVATFLAGNQSGTVTITATVPDLGISGSTSVKVSVEPALAFAAASLPELPAGSTATVQVSVRLPGGGTAVTDSGRRITLSATPESGSPTTLTATDQNGMASFSLSETAAGSYRLSASADGVSPADGPSLTVVPGAASALSLRATPSFLVAPGQVASLYATATDAYGNVVQSAVPVNLTASGGGGTLQVLSGQVSSSTPAGRFTGSSRSGSATITLTAPGSGLAPAQLTLSVEPSPAAVVSGKGMWLRYYELKSIGVGNIVQRASNHNITHIYVEVGSTYQNDGFWAGPDWDQILAAAHRAHIAVIAWIYDTLYSPSADLALARQAVDYTAPSGDRADGLALDLETDETMTPAIVGPFDQQLRRMVGPSYPLIAVPYPPQFRPNYPFRTLAQTMNAFAPMDYWHVHARPYSGQEAAQFVTNSINQLRAATGNPNLAVSVIGQAYDLFGDPSQSPSAAEIAGAENAARSAGAIGFSLYEWGLITPEEWNTFNSIPW